MSTVFRGSFTPQVNPMHKKPYGLLPPLPRVAVPAASPEPISPVRRNFSLLQSTVGEPVSSERVVPRLGGPIVIKQPAASPGPISPVIKKITSTQNGVSFNPLPVRNGRYIATKRSTDPIILNPLSTISEEMPLYKKPTVISEYTGLPSGSPPIVPAATLERDNTTLDTLRSILGSFQIRPDFLQHLLQLEGYEISLILDDSGSMESDSDAPEPPGFKKFSAGNSYGYRWTRLEEMKYISRILISVATIFDKNGVDLYFLNSGTHNNVTNVEQFDIICRNLNSGSTPLVSNFHQASGKVSNKKHLIFIITDGQPDEGVTAFKNALINKSEYIYVSILACTGDDYAVDYLNDIDETVPNVDCVDDYTSERNEILFVQGTDFPFSYGDYIVKALLGAVDPAFDLLDERNLLDNSYIIKYDDYINAEKDKTYIIMRKRIDQMSPNERKKYMVGNFITLKKRSNKFGGAYVQDTVKIIGVSGNRLEINQPLTHNYKRGILSSMAAPFRAFGSLVMRRHGGTKTKRRRNKKTRRNRKSIKKL